MFRVPCVGKSKTRRGRSWPNATATATSGKGRPKEFHDRGIILDALGLKGGNPMIADDRLHRWGLRSLPATGGPVGLRQETNHLGGLVCKEGYQCGHGKTWGSQEDHPDHHHSPALTSFLIFRLMRSRLSREIRSRYRRPSRWSISWEMTRARRPSASLSTSSPRGGLRPDLYEAGALDHGGETGNAETALLSLFASLAVDDLRIDQRKPLPLLSSNRDVHHDHPQVHSNLGSRQNRHPFPRTWSASGLRPDSRDRYRTARPAN